jgi:transcriptional regulator of heat shock response
MNIRQSKLLIAIIDEFISTALPVGSRQLVERGNFNVSGATIRNEMQALSEEGLIAQPHISAGRVPTAKGYRMYVKDFMEPAMHEQQVRKHFETLKDQYLVRKDQERVYDAVALLSQMTPNVVFAKVPHKSRVYFLGLANALRQPEFQANPSLVSGVVEVLENSLADLLDSVEVDETVRYYIGDEHVLPQIESCSLMVKSYDIRGNNGAIGIVGPMRMDYAYNTIALELVSDLLESA